MYSQVEETDTLMGEFQIPADYYAARNLPALPNAWLQAYVDHEHTYFILVTNKDANRSRVLRATTDALDASSFFHVAVGTLGYTNDQRATETQKMIERFLGRKKWD